MAQSGGHAWADWFKLGGEGVVINMRALNSVEVDAEKGQAVIGGGAIVGEVMRAAGARGMHVSKSFTGQFLRRKGDRIKGQRL